MLLVGPFRNCGQFGPQIKALVSVNLNTCASTWRLKSRFKDKNNETPLQQRRLQKLQNRVGFKTVHGVSTIR